MSAHETVEGGGAGLPGPRDARRRPGAAEPDGLEGGGAEARRAQLLAWCRAQTDDLREALAWAQRLEAFITGGLGPACGPAYPPYDFGPPPKGFGRRVGGRRPGGAATPQAPDQPPGESAGWAEQAGKEAAPVARGACEGAAISLRQSPDARGNGESGAEARTRAAGGAREARSESNEGGRAAGPEPRRRMHVLALIERAAEEGRRCPSNAEIARAVGVGTQAASAAVQRLAQAGDIAIEDSGPMGRVVFVPKLDKRTAPLSSKAGTSKRANAAAGAKAWKRANAAAGAMAWKRAGAAAGAKAQPAPAKRDSASGSPAAVIGRDIRAAIPAAFSAAQREAVLAAVESLTALGGERVQALSPGLWRVEGRRATAEDLVKRASHQRRMAGLEPIAWPRRGTMGRIP